MSKTIKNKIISNKTRKTRSNEEKPEDRKIYESSLQFLEEYARSNPYSKKTMIQGFHELVKKGYIFMNIGNDGTILKIIGQRNIVKIFNENGRKECSILEKMNSSQENPYINPDKIHCRTIDHTSFISTFGPLLQIFPMDQQDEYYIMTMPYLGIDFEQFLSSSYYLAHIKKSKKENPDLPCISIKEYKNISIALLNFYNKIKKMMYVSGIIHNDLKLNNIIYIKRKNYFVLIDFDNATFLDSNPRFSKETNNDLILFFKKIVLEFLYYAIGNQTILNHIKPLVIELEHITNTVPTDFLERLIQHNKDLDSNEISSKTMENTIQKNRIS